MSKRSKATDTSAIYKTLLVVTTLWVAVEITSNLQGIFAYRLIRSLLEIIMYGGIPSLGIVLCLSMLLRRKFSLLEFLNICIPAGLLLIPTLLTLEYIMFGSLPSFLPIAHLILIAGAIIGISRLLKVKVSEYIPVVAFPTHLKWATVASLLIYTSLIIVLFSRYYPLPDPDPYDWMLKYGEFDTQQFQIAASGRPLFYFLIYFLHKITHIDLYAIFKYVLPFLSLILLLPCSLIAQKFTNTRTQLLVMLAPLASASTILYLQTSIPQTISLIMLVFIVYVLTYSRYTNDRFWYWVGGVCSLGTFFYHESGSIISMAWVLATVWHFRHTIISFIQHNKLVTFLFVLLLLSNSQLIIPFVRFTTFWLYRIWQFAELTGNWQFPAYFINVDGNTVGWAGITGIGKYYIYYVGPFIFTLLISIIATGYKNSSFKQYLRSLLHTPAAQCCLIGFIIVFTIAEIMPRLIDISFLPDRAWLFAHFFLLFFLLAVLQYASQTPHSFLGQRAWVTFTILCIGLNIGGALYINETKKYINPDYKQNSIAWIKSNLPPESIFIATSDTYLLKFHSRANLVYAPAPLFCLKNTAQNANQFLELLKGSGYVSDPDSDERAIYVQAINSYFSSHAEPDSDDLISVIEQTKHSIEKSYRDPRPLTKKYPIYIYRAKPHPLDPFARRPYNLERSAYTICQEPNLDNYPNLFEKVYDDKGLVKIWRIL